MEPVTIGMGLVQFAGPVLNAFGQGRWQGGKSLIVRIGYKPFPRIGQKTRMEIYIDLINNSKRRINLSVISCEVWACGEEDLNVDKWTDVKLERHAPETNVWLEPNEAHTERYWVVVKHPDRFVRVWAHAGSKQAGFLCHKAKTVSWQYHDVFDLGDMVKEAAIGTNS